MKILVVQRGSHVATAPFSLSVAARITEPLDYLADRGEVSYVTVGEVGVDIDGYLKWADAVIFSKHFSPESISIAEKARKRGLRTVYDLDDWILEFPAYSGGSLRQSGRIENILKFFELVDVVTVSNERILREIRQYFESPILVPNGMYVEKYGLSCEKPYDPPRVVFTNADVLKIEASKQGFIRALQDFFQSHPEYILDCFGDPFPEIHSLPIMHFTSRMPYEDYMHCLVAGKYSFAVTPLGGIEDRESLLFNGCKNPFKFLNYGAAGVPGIYSRTPIYENCIIPDSTGLLVENSYGGWRDSMERMVVDIDLRERIRNNALLEVKAKHHIRFSATSLLGALTANALGMMKNEFVHR